MREIIKHTLIVSAVCIIALTFFAVLTTQAHAQTFYAEDFNDQPTGLLSGITPPWSGSDDGVIQNTAGVGFGGSNGVFVNTDLDDPSSYSYDFPTDLTGDFSFLGYMQIGPENSGDQGRVSMIYLSGDAVPQTGVNFWRVGSNNTAISAFYSSIVSNLITGDIDQIPYWYRIVREGTEICWTLWPISNGEPSPQHCQTADLDSYDRITITTESFNDGQYDYVVYDNIDISAESAPPPPIPQPQSRIVRVLSPEQNEVTASTTVNVSVEYVSNVPVPSEVCIAISDLTFGQSLDAICDDVTQSGELTFATTTVLTAGHQYQIWGILRDAENNEISNSFSLTRTFYVVDLPDDIIDPGQGWGVNPDPITGTSTTALCDVIDSGIPRSFCRLASFLLTPDANSRAQLNNAYANLDTKIPFSILSELSGAWEEIELTDRPEKSFNFIWNGEEIPVVASSTFNTYLGSDSVGIIRYWIALGLWVSLAFLLYFRVSRLI